MDYDLQVGDTIKSGQYYQTYLYGPTRGITPLKVIAEDSISLNGNKFMIYYTDSTGAPYAGIFAAGYFFIEGLGHINGVFEYGYAQEYYSHPFENCPGVDTIIFNCDCAHLAGINESREPARIEIYPVPATKSIQLSKKINGKITISNSLGEKIGETDCRSCDELDIASLPKGIYLLEITEGVSVVRKRIIKE